MIPASHIFAMNWISIQGRARYSIMASIRIRDWIHFTLALLEDDIQVSGDKMK
jgi:hypothetical protein